MANQQSPDQSVEYGIPTAERVIKICLIVNTILGAILLVLGLIRGRNFVDLLGSVVLSVAPLYFFYSFSNTNRRSHVHKY